MGRTLTSRMRNLSLYVISLAIIICSIVNLTILESQILLKNLDVLETGVGDVGGEDIAESSYQPGSAEQFILTNSDRLGFNQTNNPATCKIWKDPSATNPDVLNSLREYAKDIERYNELVNNFGTAPSIMEDLRQGTTGQSLHREICDSLRLHPDGLQGIFSSGQLSLTSSGYAEPLLPPMRSQKICDNREQNLMSLDYLVHDFEFMCRKLKPTSRLVLVDMGASLQFSHHGSTEQPIVSLLRKYQKFGFVFDHIYGFEITKIDPKNVFEKSLPEEYIPAYHWINVGVSAEEGNKLNPLHSVVKKFNKDDFVVVKLDIDTSSVELPLMKQLLEDKDGVFSKIVDQFYFEHHVHLGELADYWTSSIEGTEGTVAQSLEWFSLLRKKGIPAHYWP